MLILCFNQIFLESQTVMTRLNVLIFSLIFLKVTVAAFLPVPADLKVTSFNETEVAISWTPASVNDKIDGYHVRATPLKSPARTTTTMVIDMTLTNASTKVTLRDLHPGTLYTIGLHSFYGNETSQPASVEVWTEIGYPETPPAVDVLWRKGQKMAVKIYPGESNKGPISGLQIIVLEKTTIISFNEDQLFNHSVAEDAGFPFYVTAFLRNYTDDTFIVGDGKSYDGYFNAPLDENSNYEVRIGVVSEFNKTVKVSFSPLQSDLLTINAPYNDNSEYLDSPSLSVSKIVGVAVGVSFLLLVALVILYFVLRKHYGKRRLSDEMVLHDQITDTEENGFAHGILHIGDDTNLGDFWELLKERYWSIPKELLDISEEVLGKGHFGEVRRGTVHKRGKPISVLVQFSQSHSVMVDSERRVLYSEVDAQLRLGTHVNVAEFVGICEDRGMLHLVAECFDTNLRGLLLRSRQQTGPRFCALSEHFLLEMALGIVQGLKYITDHGVLHKHLSSRSIAILDGYQPKIANFGLFFYHPTGKKLDYSRWLAPEAARSRTYTVKSDVWSFGVLLWEICTLAATPFAEIPSQEVYPRTIRGLRLPHPTGLSDELFQLMLQCWELDADERPTFHELSAVLQNVLLSPTDHLRFDRVSGFQFYKFDPKGDEQ